MKVDWYWMLNQPNQSTTYRDLDAISMARLAAIIDRAK
jgi:hypothetical protein